MRILRLIENMTIGRNAVGYLTESLHGAGSPQRNVSKSHAA
jgi:4-hydroxybutyryl-CoA dehydratase/vinylacetyl-CoA-Delta-isomerase